MPAQYNLVDCNSQFLGGVVALLTTASSCVAVTFTYVLAFLSLAIILHVRLHFFRARARLPMGMMVLIAISSTSAIRSWRDTNHCHEDHHPHWNHNNGTNSALLVLLLLGHVIVGVLILLSAGTKTARQRACEILICETQNCQDACVSVFTVILAAGSAGNKTHT
jgi:uncharacterized integral membrane protein